MTSVECPNQSSVPLQRLLWLLRPPAFLRIVARHLLAKGGSEPLARIVLAILLLSPLGCPAQAQPNPDITSSEVVYFSDLKLACPQVDTTDVAAVGRVRGEDLWSQ